MRLLAIKEVSFFCESEVYLTTCQEEKRVEGKWDDVSASTSKLDFVDPLEIEAGLRLEVGPVASLERDDIGLDPFIVSELRNSLDQTSHKGDIGIQFGKSLAFIG